MRKAVLKLRIFLLHQRYAGALSLDRIATKTLRLKEARSVLRDAYCLRVFVAKIRGKIFLVALEIIKRFFAVVTLVKRFACGRAKLAE